MELGANLTGMISGFVSNNAGYPISGHPKMRMMKHLGSQFRDIPEKCGLLEIRMEECWD